MGNSLPKYGITATVTGLPAFQKAMDAVKKKIDDVTGATKDAGDDVAPFNDGMDEAGEATDSFREKLTSFIQQKVPFGNAITGMTDLIADIPVPTLIAVAAVVALTTAFLQLGQRGAALQEVGKAYDNLTASVGVNSQQLLKDLRAASDGTVADFDLIKTASTALLGVSGDLGKSLGNTLPQFLKIAKVEADATGRSVNDLFNDLVEGVKKGTPKLIESTGLVIDQKAAYEDFAKSVGKTTSQLTDQDRSMALLAATLDAGNKVLAQFGDTQESNADKLDRTQATITNIFDSLAIAVQPAYGVVLDGVQKVLNIFQQLELAVAPIFGGIASIVANVFGNIIDIVTSIAQPIVDVISSIAPYFALAFQTIANILGGVGKVIGGVVNGIVSFLSGVAKTFFGLDLKNLGPELFNGAAAAFGSFANGILSVANKLIFPAVIGIAQFIADFLIGFSPPKEGPLSVIDQGGENLMIAWLNGIAGVSLDPVDQVAQQVSDALGDIGKESLGTVNKRLAQLDTALQPFQDRLDIVKANLDALAQPAQDALDAINKQETDLQNALAQGDPAAAARLQLLDQQKDVIQQQLDAQQGIVDSAQIQLALAKAQQAPERALLTIRQNNLQALAKAQPKTTPEKTGGGADKTPKEKQGSSSGVVPDTDTSGGISAPAGGAPSVLDTISGQDQVDQAQQGIQNAFMGQIDTSNLDEFGTNVSSLQTQLGRIGSVDIGSKLKDKFKGLTDLFDPSVQNSPANIIQTLLGNLTADENTPGSIASFFKDIKLNGVEPTVSKALSDLGDHVFNADLEGSPANTIRGAVRKLVADRNTNGSIAFELANLPQHISDLQSTISQAVTDLGIASLFDPTVQGSPANLLQGSIQTLADGPQNPDSIAGIFNNLGPNLTTAGDYVKSWLKTNVVPIFDPTVKDSPAYDIVQLVTNLTGDQKQGDSVASFFADLPGNVSDAASGLYGDLQKNVFDPVTNFLSGTGDDTMSGVLDSFVALFTNLPGQIVNSLKSLGVMVWNAIGVPIISAINTAIGYVQEGVRNIATFFANQLGSIIGGFDSSALGGIVPQSLRDFQAGLSSTGTTFTIPLLSTALPDFLKAAGSPPGAATGGLLGGGLFRVGENGPETLFSGSRFGVLPNQFTRVLGDLSNVLAQPASLPVGGNTYNSSDSSTMTNNFYGVQGSNDVIRRMAQLRARG